MCRLNFFTRNIATFFDFAPKFEQPHSCLIEKSQESDLKSILFLAYKLKEN